MSAFWLGICIGVFVNLATGVLISLIFETLQRRRDLQRQLGEIWLLATRASEAVNHSGLRKDGGAEAYAHWLELQDEWLRARYSLNFALSSEKRQQLEDAIAAIYELQILNSDKRNRKYLKLYPIVVTQSANSVEQAEGQTADAAGDGAIGDNGDAAIEEPEFVDFGTWAAHNGKPEERAAFDEFQAYRQRLDDKIEPLLHFNPFVIARSGEVENAQSLPDELAQTWHFGFLFSRVWNWFFSEIYFSISKPFRDRRRRK